MILLNYLVVVSLIDLWLHHINPNAEIWSRKRSWHQVLNVIDANCAKVWSFMCLTIPKWIIASIHTIIFTWYLLASIASKSALDHLVFEILDLIVETCPTERLREPHSLECFDSVHAKLLKNLSILIKLINWLLI